MLNRRWVRVAASGVVYSGPCLVHSIIATPAGADEWHDVYDGRDATAGKLFCRVQCKSEETRGISFGQGVPFDVGIYVAVQNPGDAVTIVFTPLEE